MGPCHDLGLVSRRYVSFNRRSPLVTRWVTFKYHVRALRPIATPTRYTRERFRSSHS